MNLATLRSSTLWLAPALAVALHGAIDGEPRAARPTTEARASQEQPSMQVHYLEIVTPDVDATCTALGQVHGVTFSAPEAGLGNARTARLATGLVGVRGPMRSDEEPVVRPYVLVDDIDSAVEAVEAAGGEIALPPMEIPERGKCAIYLLGGIQHGLWQI